MTGKIQNFDTQQGQFVVKTKLAQGGCADVYLCELVTKNHSTSEYVVKIPRDNSKELKNELLNDSLALQSFNHPHIVKSFGCHQLFGKRGLVLEYIKGGDLYSLIPTLTIHEREALALRVAIAGISVLRSIHKKGLCHGDISSKNILVSRFGHIKITDFGLSSSAKLKQRALSIKGNPRYLSPRRWRGHMPSPKDDYFSLALVIIELLAGSHPFKTFDLCSIKTAVMAGFFKLEWKKVAPRHWHALISSLIQYKTQKNTVDALLKFTL